MAPSGPLDGIRVFDLSSVIMGPLATQILGDLGADVITVEATSLSLNREMTDGPAPGLSGLSLNLLRNKRSVVVDLAGDTGRGLALRLAASCDVFVSNLRPASLRRLGLDHAAVRAANPSIVYCQAQGFPSDGPSADEPAYDDIIQAATGLADVARRVHGEPQLVPTLVADKVCGMAIAQAVLAALVRRERTGQGAQLEVAMTDAFTSFLLVEHAAAATARPAQGHAGYERILTPSRRPAATRDGWIHVLPYTAENYTALFEVGGRPELADDRIGTFGDRVRNSDTLYRDVHEILATRTTGAWLAFCRERGIPAVEVATLDDLVDRLPDAEHPTAGRYKAIRPMAVWDGQRDPGVARPAPRQGEHTREVLAELGLAGEEITALLEAGVVLDAPVEG